jgi:hypothetical protein
MGRGTCFADAWKWLCEAEQMKATPRVWEDPRDRCIPHCLAESRYLFFVVALAMFEHTDAPFAL